MGYDLERDAPALSLNCLALMATTYTTAQLRSFPWIVSSATLRTEDLIPALSSALAQILSSLDQPPFELSSQAEELLSALELPDAEELPGDELVDRIKARRSSLEQLSELCADLFDMLDALAPIGFSFSYHEGDGALFGFWLSSEICSELERLNLGADSDSAALAELLQELESSGVDLWDLESSFYAEASGSTEAEAGRDFAQCLAEDTLELSSEWPFRCIDWEQAWEELRQDGYVLTPSLTSSSTFYVWLPQ